MNTDRRSFLKTSTLLLGGILINNSKVFSALDTNRNFREIRNNFGLYNENGGTIAWYAKDDAVIVVDSQFPESAKNFITDLHSKNSHKINVLFNTHQHRDHTMGNYILRDYTKKIIAHENCPKLQIMQSKGTENEKYVVTADETFSDEKIITLPNEIVKAKYFGPAHTGGDITIHFENLNIAHIGDLVFNKAYPYIDNNGGGTVKGWIEVLSKLIEYYDNDTKFVFGHADKDENVFGSKNDLIDMKAYFLSLVDYVYSLVKNGKTPDEIAETNNIPGVPVRFEKWEGARKMNLKMTAEQLNE